MKTHKDIYDKYKELYKQPITLYKYKTGITPCIGIITVGNNNESLVYVKHKIKFITDIGGSYSLKQFDDDVDESEIIKKINEFNQAYNIFGIIIQLPLPKIYNKEKIINTIEPILDIDGLHPVNIGNFFSNSIKFYFIPATVYGIKLFLQENELSLQGKKVLIMGRSLLVGKPLLSLVLNMNGLPTLLHSHSTKKQIQTELLTSDYIISAIGVKHYFDNKFYYNENSMIFDIGINVENKKLYGDCDYDYLKNKVSYISPVPNGFGKLTIIGIFNNLIYNVNNLY